MSNEEIIWAWLSERIGNEYGVAGLMGNLQAESGLRPNNLENRYADASGWTDEGYTAAVDCGAITREMFQDGAGYGLAQWTYWSRKRDLYDFAKSQGVSIGDLGMQLAYLWAELKQYGAVLTTLMNAKSVREASDAVLVGYEKPANQSKENREARARMGQAIYDRRTGRKDEKGVKLNEKAEACVKLAEEKLGDPYVYGAWGDPCTVKIRKQYAGYNPAYKGKIYGACPVLDGEEPDCTYCKWNGHLCYDCRGFTHYILKTAAGIKLDGAGATSQYDKAANWEEKGNISKMPNAVCCVFKYKDGKMSHTGLHIGDGMIIHCSTIVKRGAVSDTTWTHYAVPKGLYTAEELKEAGAVKMKPTLKSGSSGDAVRELQEDLKGLGFDPGTVDGKFGTKTREAVMAFQLAYGLTADGIVGGVTWQEIEKQQSLKNKKDAAEQDKAPPEEEKPEEKPEGKEEEKMIMFMLPEDLVRELYEYLKKLLGEGD
ncbi:MAG: peptidoglycan-binding protein [Clostridia bacterium]|nr:peptidoglycan-binding protein [Clostridia bacterium]